MITADKDFGEIVFRRGHVARGVILIRLAGMKPRDKAARVAGAVVQLNSNLVGAFVVVGLRQLRTRPFPLR